MKLPLAAGFKPLPLLNELASYPPNTYVFRQHEDFNLKAIRFKVDVVLIAIPLLNKLAFYLSKYIRIQSI